MGLVREDILENFQTVLTQISVDNGYGNDMESVQRFKQHGNSLEKVPCCIISAAPEEQEPGPDPLIKALLTVEVDLFHRQDPDDDRDTDTLLNSLLLDIIKALYTVETGGYPAHTRGGLAQNTTIKNIIPFETTGNNPHSGLIILVEVLYFYYRSNPAQAG